jgi:SAM-dependent methyltransferase
MSAPGTGGGNEWALGRTVRVARCPACGGDSRDPSPYLARDYLGADTGDVWALWRCSTCASLFLDPRPDDGSLAATYRSYYTHTAPDPAGIAEGVPRFFWGLMNGYLYQRFRWDRSPRYLLGGLACSLLVPLARKLDYMARHLFAKDFPRPGLLVDVGCGNGEFLLQAREMGWTVRGVDPDGQAVSTCRAGGLDVTQGGIDSLSSSLGGSVDVVTLNNCIEHVVDPISTLACAHGLLKPGGRLWLSTPNPEGIGIRVFGRAWRGLEPSRHLCVPSQGQLLRMLDAAGFANARLLARGEHGKTITRESALVLRLQARDSGKRTAWRAWLAVPVRVLASLAGTFSPGWCEETIVIAERPCSRTPVVDGRPDADRRSPGQAAPEA